MNDNQYIFQIEEEKSESFDGSDKIIDNQE
jgi:hypothetical protein